MSGCVLEYDVTSAVVAEVDTEETTEYLAELRMHGVRFKRDPQSMPCDLAEVAFA